MDESTVIDDVIDSESSDECEEEEAPQDGSGRAGTRSSGDDWKIVGWLYTVCWALAGAWYPACDDASELVAQAPASMPGGTSPAAAQSGCDGPAVLT